MQRCEDHRLYQTPGLPCPNPGCALGTTLDAIDIHVRSRLSAKLKVRRYKRVQVLAETLTSEGCWRWRSEMACAPCRAKRRG